jgi:hypothetical protein
VTRGGTLYVNDIAGKRICFRIMVERKDVNESLNLEVFSRAVCGNDAVDIVANIVDAIFKSLKRLWVFLDGSGEVG